MELLMLPSTHLFVLYGVRWSSSQTSGAKRRCRSLLRVCNISGAHWTKLASVASCGFCSIVAALRHVWDVVSSITLRRQWDDADRTTWHVCQNNKTLSMKPRGVALPQPKTAPPGGIEYETKNRASRLHYHYVILVFCCVHTHVFRSISSPIVSNASRFIAWLQTFLHINRCERFLETEQRAHISHPLTPKQEL